VILKFVFYGTPERPNIAAISTADDRQVWIKIGDFDSKLVLWVLTERLELLEFPELNENPFMKYEDVQRFLDDDPETLDNLNKLVERFLKDFDSMTSEDFETLEPVVRRTESA